MKAKVQNGKVANPGQSFAESLQNRIQGFGGEDVLSWIYGNDIEKVWNEFSDAREALDGHE